LDVLSGRKSKAQKIEMLFLYNDVDNKQQQSKMPIVYCVKNVEMPKYRKYVLTKPVADYLCERCTELGEGDLIFRVEEQNVNKKIYRKAQKEEKTWARKKHEHSLYDWMKDNLIQWRNGTLADWKVKELEEIYDKEGKTLEQMAQKYGV
jgi:hypothetical protein